MKPWLLLFALVLGCSKGTPTESSQSLAVTDARGMAAPADSQAAPPPTDAAGGASCTTDADCRLFDDYCKGCDCRVLGKDEKDPTCAGPGVRCLRQPCADRVAICDRGKCAIKDVPKR
jgi:hypothetical protein